MTVINIEPEESFVEIREGSRAHKSHNKSAADDSRLCTMM